ncbi:type II CRISPR-associated endonuclease Cas1 [Dongia sp.]|uniref:type II CRISPR-associated endonuclease Cas1 n=1 Tax=Dongia sp. TaxID=1977262 RepID=UPI0035B09A02
MVGRVVEIETDGRHIALQRGFLMVMDKGSELGRVPLDDIAAVVANAHGLTYTNNVLVELSGRGIPVVLCGANHMPAAIVWPVDAHHVQTGRMNDQVEASQPLKKQLWSQLVRAKILSQAATLEAVGAAHGGFYLLSRKVRSGDPDNVEAEAARRYWPLLMGTGFKRDKDGAGTNAMLNYGYAVLRAGVARAVMAAGLHPGFGLMHSNRGNPMVLVDDLMEPFRPVVDREVHHLLQQGMTEVNGETKATLARIMVLDLPTASGRTPMMLCAERLARSLAHAFAGEGKELDLPLPARPLEA